VQATGPAVSAQVAKIIKISFRAKSQRCLSIVPWFDYPGHETGWLQHRACRPRLSVFPLGISGRAVGRMSGPAKCMRSAASATRICWTARDGRWNRAGTGLESPKNKIVESPSTERRNQSTDAGTSFFVWNVFVIVTSDLIFKSCHRQRKCQVVVRHGARRTAQGARRKAHGAPPSGTTKMLANNQTRTFDSLYW